MNGLARSFASRGVHKSALRTTGILLAATLTFLGARAEAQSPVSLKWTETWPPRTFTPNNPVAIAADDGGNVIVVGNSGDSPLAIKYDTNGNTVWMNWLSSQNIEMASTAKAVGTDAAGDVFVLSTLTVSISLQQLNITDTALAKYNAAGVRQWIDFSSVNTPTFALAVTPDGEAYILTARQLQNSAGVVTVKYDANGKQVWERVEPLVQVEVGDAVEGLPVAIRLDGQGNVYTAANNGLGGEIFQYDPDGNLLNTIGLGTLGLIRKYQVDGAGNSYVLGGAASTQDRIVAKFSADGTLLWKNDLGPELSEPSDANGAIIDDTLKDIGVDLAGDVFTLQDEPSTPATPSGWDMVILKFSASGTREWAERFNTTREHTDQDRATAMAVSAVGETYITGFPNLGPDQGDTVTAKFNPAGTQVWERSLGIQLAGAIAIALGTNGQVFVESAGGPTGFEWYTTDYAQQ